MLITFLSKIKLQHILIVVIIALFLMLSYLWNRVTFHKGESDRKGDNYVALQNFDSLKVAHLTFKSEKEIADYVNSNADIKKIMEKQKDEYDGKIKKLTSIIYQQNVYIDKIQQSTDVSSLIANIKNNISATESWVDSTECLTVRGKIVFDKSKLTNVVTDRTFKNDMVITGHLQRSQRNWWTRTFGTRKEAVTTVTSNCGETKTVIIDKIKK